MNMEVFITYQKDGYGGIMVDKVFSNEQDVRAYVTTKLMIANSKSIEELGQKQEEQFTRHVVININNGSEEEIMSHNQLKTKREKTLNIIYKMKYSIIRFFKNIFCKSNDYKFAKSELDILEKTLPCSTIKPFKKEILAICEAFGESGQSGGSAPFVATAIADTIKSLCLFQPICDVTGHESEWFAIQTWNENTNITYQNKRCSALFKDEIENKAYYLNAIVWQGEEKYNTYTGSVYIDNNSFELINSRQNVRFPFKPKTFYIDVINVPIEKEEAEQRNLWYVEDKNGEYVYTVLKDPKQLDTVFEYYDKNKK